MFTGFFVGLASSLVVSYKSRLVYISADVNKILASKPLLLLYNREKQRWKYRLSCIGCNSNKLIFLFGPQSSEKKLSGFKEFAGQHSVVCKDPDKIVISDDRNESVIAVFEQGVTTEADVRDIKAYIDSTSRINFLGWIWIE